MIGQGVSTDLARNVLGRLGHEGLACVGEPVDRADLRSQLALIDEPGGVPQLRTARIAYEVNCADVVSIGLRGSHHGHQRTTGLDDGWWLGEHVAAGGVIDRVDLTHGRRPVVPLDVHEILGAKLKHALARRPDRFR